MFTWINTGPAFCYYYDHLLISIMNAVLFFILHAIIGIFATTCVGRITLGSSDDYVVEINLRPTTTELNHYLDEWYNVLHRGALPDHEILRDKMKQLEYLNKGQNGFFQMFVTRPGQAKREEYTTRWSDIKNSLLPSLIEEVGHDTLDAHTIKSTFPSTNPVRSFMLRSSREARMENLDKWLNSILNGKQVHGANMPISLSNEVKAGIRRRFDTFCTNIRFRYSGFHLEGLGWPKVQFDPNV